MRLIAPLLVLTVLGVVALRWIADPVREREQAWIAGSWDLATQRPDVKEQLTARLAGQLERHSNDPETRWFAARAYLKIGEIRRAIDAVWGDPALADAPGTPRRFGALMLRCLGFLDDERLRVPHSGAAMAALLLAEGGDEEAAVWLDETIRTRLQGGFLTVLSGTFLYSTGDGALRVSSALRVRGEPLADVLASLAAMRPEAYPERGADLERLEEIVLRDTDRQRQRIVWSTACVALGRSEDARALDVLKGLYDRLSRSEDEWEQHDAAVVASGLLAGGRWSRLETLRPYLRGQVPDALVRLWIAEAIHHRLARGDPEALPAWLEVWQSLGRFPDVHLAERVATALLLRDALPPAELSLDHVLGPLESRDAPITMHAIAAAWRYRNGEPAGREALLRVLEQLEEGGWPGDNLMIADALWISPVLTTCRALVLYDPSQGP